MAKDNILLITTDQQRSDTLNAWGNQSIFTPHLNYMAAMGISYKNCYASCPICVPSRTTIMTGRQGYESGVISNETHETFMRACTEERSTLPAVLTDAGYQTCAKGKMHFEPARAHYGFEHMKLPLDYMREYDKKQVLAHPKAHGVGECEVEPVISTVEVKDSITSWIAEEAIDFLETRDTTRPFFLWTSFTKPHPPFDPCRDFWELYDNIPMPDAVTGDWSRTVEETPQGFLAGAYENTNLYLLGKAQSFSDTIINNTPNGILVLNESLEIQQINRAALQMMNLSSPSDVTGEPVVRVLDPGDFFTVLESGQSIEKKRIYLSEYDRYAEETIIPDHEFHQIICILRDVTEEERVRRQKEELSRQTAEIADGVVAKQMRIVQEIASLLGETAAETKIALYKLKGSVSDE